MVPECWVQIYDDKIQVAGNFSYRVETIEPVIDIMGRRYDFAGDEKYFFWVIKILRALTERKPDV